MNVSGTIKQKYDFNKTNGYDLSYSGWKGESLRVVESSLLVGSFSEGDSRITFILNWLEQNVAWKR